VLDQVEGLVDGVVGANQKIGAGAGEFVGGREHEFGNACPVSRIDVLHIFCERVRVQGDFRMIVLTEELRALRARCCGSRARSFGATSDDADVERHFSGQLPAGSSVLVKNEGLFLIPNNDFTTVEVW